MHPTLIPGGRTQAFFFFPRGKSLPGGCSLLLTGVQGQSDNGDGGKRHAEARTAVRPERLKIYTACVLQTES